MRLGIIVAVVEAATDISSVTLAVLAGGEGRRMGFPKQHLQINGRPILEFLLDRFDWPGPTLLITTPGREKPARAEAFDAEAVDAVQNQGPLRGVLTALENTTTDLVVVTTVDMPAISAEHLQWIAERLISRPEIQGLMLRRIIDGKEEIEPFPFACRRDAATVVATQLASERRSLHSLAKLPAIGVEPAPAGWPASVWTNLNLPAEFQTFIDLLK
jgi:molybdopterin-guanine dinucleotide biosynthesis protein A